MAKIPFLIFIGSFFGWWVLFIFLERVLGFRANIHTQNAISEMEKKYYAKVGKGKPNKQLPVFQMNTRSLDSSGNYREKMPSALLFLKSFCSIILVILTVWQLLRPEGLTEMVSYLFQGNTSHLDHPFLQNSVPMLLSWYLFENIYLLKYQKLKWSAFIHHWLTILAITLILLEVYFPIALWYGIFGVGLPFPISFLQGMKNQYASKFPKFTQIGFKVIFFYYSGLAIIGILGALVIVFQGYNLEVTGLAFSCFLLLCTFAWAYDDLNYAKALRRYGKMNYEGFEIS